MQTTNAHKNKLKVILNIPIFDFIPMFTYMLCVCTMCMPVGPLSIVFIDGHECWQLNSGPLGKQLFFTAALSPALTFLL